MTAIPVFFFIDTSHVDGWILPRFRLRNRGAGECFISTIDWPRKLRFALTAFANIGYWATI